jgi:hypothetical protein
MKTFKILFLLPVVLFAQTSKTDTTRVNEIPMSFSTFFNPLSHLQDPFILDQFESLEMKTDLLNDSSSIWMKTRLQLAYMNSANYSDAKTNILNPLYKQYIASQDLKLLKQILGAVQIGAVGYLAYLHLKKYGFLKKK